MSKTIPLLFLFLLVPAQAQEKLSPQQQMDYYRAQTDSAGQERNASKTASVYGRMVTLCRDNPVFENELPEILYLYGMWSAYAGNYQTAIDALVKLLDMSGHPDDKALFTIKARANNQLGLTYFFLKRWDDALVHYRKALDMATELQDTLGISITENNIGNIHQKKENYAQAIEHYLRCLQLQETIGDRETIGNVYHNLATCYSETGNFTESLAYFDLALNMARETGDREIEALCLIGLARYRALEKHQFTEAVKLVAQAELIAKEAGYRQVLAEVYQSRSVMDKERGDFASALEYFTQYKALSDEMFNEQSTNQLHEYEVRYQTQEKEIEIVRQQAEIEKHKRRAAVLVITAVLMTALAVVLLVSYRKIHRKNIAITRQILENTRIGSTVAATPENYMETPDDEWFQKIENYLRESKLYLTPNINRSTLAAHLQTNERYISDSVKDSTGMTFNEYINSLRLAHACALLSDPENNCRIEEIAGASGFNNRVSFYRCFVAKYDIPPDEFRKLACCTQTADSAVEQ